MAAVVSGGSLGVQQTSLALLGGAGQVGAATHGRAGERVYLNAATGNLVIQGQDEVLIGRGPDAALLRTYNSRGLLDDDNGDNWRLGLYRRVYGLTGTANTAGSTVRRTDADGAEAVYTYNATLGKYLTAEGAGAYDTLSYDATTQTWTWVDGDSAVTETYDGANGGRLTRVTDPSGNALTLTYTGSLLTAVQTASGETTYLDYTGVNLTRVRTVTSAAVTLVRTSYTYDASNRLVSVTTDLTPENGADAKSYVTSYTYDGTSRRVATTTQSDGTSLAFAYVLVGSDHRVSQITDALGQLTRFAYDTIARTTTVTDPLGLATVLAYDTAGQLTRITGPAVGGASQVVSYAYDASGNVTQVTDARGNVVAYQYDTNGNRILDRDAAGNTVQRVFGAKNELLSETTYSAVATSVASSTGETWTIGDKAQISGNPPHLSLPGLDGSYASTADGLANSITGDIELVAKVAPDSWTGSAQHIIGKRDTNNQSYSLRIMSTGRLEFAKGNATGTSVWFAQSTGPAAVAAGQAKWVKVQVDVDNGAGGAVCSFWASDDGVTWTSLGSSTIAGAAGPMFDGTNPLEIGAAFRGTDRLFKGEIYYADVRNGINGPIVAKFDPSAGVNRQPVAPLNTRYVYDAANRLRFAVSAEGRVSEYRYNGLGQQVAAIQYTGARYNVAGLAPSASLTESQLNAWLPADKSGSMRSDTTYDFRGQVETVTTYKAANAAGNGILDGTQAVTQYVYDQAGNLLKTIDPRGSATADPNDYTTSYLYDGLGRVLSSTDALGVVTLTQYDDANRKTVVTLANGLASTSTYDAAGRLTSVLQSANSLGLGETKYFYDADGRLRRTEDPTGVKTHLLYDQTGRKVAEIDGDGSLTEYVYDANNQVIKTIGYATAVSDSSLASLADAQGKPTNVSLASIRPSLQTAPASGTGLLGEYYDNATFRLRMSRLDPTVNFNWASGAADPMLAADDFFVRWSGQVEARYSETYTFYTSSDDGVRLWVNGVLLVDNWTVHSATENSGSIALVAGQKYDIRMEYYEGVSNAVASLSWSSASQAKQIIPASQLYPAPGNRVSWNIYNEANQLVKTVDEAGFVTQRFYDAAGRLTDVLRSGNAVNTAALPDAPRAHEVNPVASSIDRLTRNFYDADGKLAGTLDGEGFLVRYNYDAAGRLVETIRHAAATTALREQGTLAQLIPATSAADIHTYNFYNARGQLARMIDGEDYLTEYVYDAAGNQTQAVRYSTKVAAKALDLPGMSGSFASTPDSPASSVTGDIEFVVKVAPESWTAGTQHIIAKRDTNNQSYALRLVSTGQLELLKGSGTAATSNRSTVPTVVDGQAKWFKVQIDVDNGAAASVAYFWQSDDGVNWTALGPAVSMGAAGPMFDGTARLEVGSAFGGTDRVFKGKIYYADVRNGINGPIVAKFDPAGASSSSATSFTSSTGEIWTIAGAAHLEPVLVGTPVASAQDQVTSFTYNALNQLVSQTSPEGTVTQYVYDQVGNLTKTVKAAGTADVRTLTAQYDKQGRLTAELSAKGAALLTGNETQAQIDAIWAAHAIKHSYDAAGRRTSTTDENGRKTLFFYNADGALTHTINALGEVRQSVYNPLGQVTKTIEYGTRLSATTLATLSGGLLSGQLPAVGAIANPALDSITKFAYTTTGLLAQKTDPLDHAVRQAFNAFGELVRRSHALGSGQTLEQTYSYDKRGLHTGTVSDPTGINASVATVYDAFGRATQSTDARGSVRKQSYDRLGRVVTSTDPLNKVSSLSYDAFDRVLTQTDALGKITRYSYNTASRSITVTTPENIATTAVKNRHGETVSITDGRSNTTTYSYDANGNLTGVTAPAAGSTTRVYDNANLLIETSDSLGTKTAFAYDAANRVLTRTVDSGAERLNLTTTYAYDAKGQTVSVTDPAGVVTQTTYDLKGQVTQVAVDPAGMNLRTSYTYDGRGKTLKVTEGAGSAQPRVTEYAYDKLGRRISERLDPGGLSATTTYAYDKNDNLVRKTDALGNVTRYTYDANDRLVHTVDALGGVTKNDYDAEGRLVRFTAYATPISLANLADTSTLNDITGRIVTSSGDQTKSYVYDGDGREIFCIDALGRVTQKIYDATGNLIRTLEYANAIPVTTALTQSAVSAALTASANDRLSRTVYDAANRAIFSIDAAGLVTQIVYDSKGNAAKEVRYANALQGTFTDNVAPQLVSTAPASGSYVIVNPASDRVTRSVYDAAGRTRYSVDALGYVTERRVDALGQETSRIRYAQAYSVADGASVASMTALLPATMPASAVLEEARYDKAGRLVETVDGLGNVTRNAYDAVGRKTDVTRAFGTAAASTTHYVYDAIGRVLEETQAFGTSVAATTRYVLDALGNRTKIIDPRGVELAETDSAWALATRNGRLAASLSAAEKDAFRAQYTTTQQFDALGRRTSTTDAAGKTTQTVYDAHDNVVKIIDPRGNAGYFYHGANNKARFHVDPLGYVTEYRYDAFDNVTHELRYANPLSGVYNESTTVDVVGQRVAAGADSANDRQTTSAYDRLGQVTAITYQGTATSYTETFAYDAFGNKVQYKDRNDAVFNYEYDARGLVKRELAPETDVVTAVVPSVVTQRARLTKVYEYDAFGNLTRMLEAFGLPQQRETRYVYDKLGRETRIEAPSFSVFDRASGTSTSRTPAVDRTYDAAGNVVMETAADGGRVLNYYDALNHKVASVDAENGLHEYEYDAAGNLIRERAYDTRLTGTLTWQTRPAPSNPEAYREMRYSYNANNLRTGTETRSETLFSYALLQSSGEGYYDAPARTSTEYNANGDVVRTVDGNGNSSYQFYDAAGNRTLQVDSLGYVTRWEYNSQGEVARETRYASALPAATLASLTTGASPQALVDAIAPSTQPENPDNRVTEYIYDRLGRVTTERKKAVAYASVNATNGQLTEQLGDLDTRFEYDGNGKVKAVILPGAQGRTDYAYDALGQLTQELKPQFQAFNGRGQALVTTREETRLAYDAYGKVAVETQLALTAAEDRVERSLYDSAGRLRTEIDAVEASTSYDYDIGGNVLRSSRQVTDVDGVNHTYRTYYTYDRLNRELSRQDIEDEGTVSQVTREIQGTRYNAHGDIEAKGTNGQFQEQYKYDRLGHLFWTNKENGTPRLYLYDANGNAVLEVHAINNDLSTVTGQTGPIPVTSPAQVRLFSPLDVQMTVSRYDARNQITDVFQPPMEFADLVSMAPVISETGTAGSPTETVTNLSAYQPVSSSQMTQVGTPQTRAASTTTTVLSGPTQTTGSVYSNGRPAPINSFQDLTVPISELGLTPGTTTVVQPPVVDAPVTVISPDGATKTVTERVTKTTVTTEVTAQADGSVIKKVTTTVDIIDRQTVFTKQVTDTYGTTEETLTTQWTLDKEEELNVDRRVDVTQDRISRRREVDTVAEYVGTVESYPGRLAYSPPGTIEARVEWIYQTVTDAETGATSEQFTGRMNVYITVPEINYYGDDPIVVTDTWENGWATNRFVFYGANTVLSNIRYDGHTVDVWKGSVHLAQFPMDRNVPYAAATLMGGAPTVSIKAQNPNAANVLFTSRLGQQWAWAWSGGGSGTEFNVNTAGLTYGDWYEYVVYDAGGNVLNHVRGEIRPSSQPQLHQNEYRLVTTERVTQKVERNIDTTNRYNYFETAESRLQNNYLRHLALQLAGGEAKANVINRRQSYNAFGEVIAEIDGRGNRTDLAYNDLGKLIRKEDPTTDVHLETGAPIRARPTTQYYFDELGQLVGTQDANSSLKPLAEKYYSTRVLVNGRVEREFDAFGNSKQLRYDRLGNERLETSEIGLDTESQYDRSGRLTRVVRYNEQGLQHSYDGFEYDLAGNRIAHTNALGLRETYLFDGVGRIRRHTSFAGRQTRYEYNYLAGIGGIGGYENRTITAGIGGDDVLTDHYDYFGKIRYHRDLGGHEFTYLYNHAGWLKEQTGTTGIAGGRNAQRIVYDYYQNGYLKSVSDTGINSFANFQYDKNGNRTFEAYAQGPLSLGVQGQNPYQLAKAEYDELNRVKHVRDDVRFDITYTYDANNNRRSIESTYFDLLANTTQQQKFYYTYDRMNRFLTTMGQRDAAGNIVRGSTGYDVQYDAAGRRARVYSDHPTTGGAAAPRRETYTYDPIGTVRDTEILDVATGAIRRTVRENDAIGRVRDYREFDVNGSQTRHIHHEYDADNLPTLEDTRDSLTPTEVQRTTFNYAGNGILASTRGETLGNANAPTVTLTYAYDKWDSYKESTVTISATAPNVNGWRPGTSTYAYDSNGHIAHVFDSQAARHLDYINNHQGQVLKRYEVGGINTSSTVVRRFYSLNGVVIGDVGTDYVPSRVDYAQALADYDRRTLESYVKRFGDARAIGTVQFGRFKLTQYESVTESVTRSRDIATRVFPVTSADFDQNYQPITDMYPAHAAGSYVTHSGDTLQSVALAVWGDSSLWYLIADANGLRGTEQIPAGTRLTLPNVVTNVHNNSETFRPYDPGLALGDTTPTLPDPPPPPQKKKKCGGLGQILTIVVLVAATVFTAGVATVGLSAGLGTIMSAGAGVLTAGFSATAVVAGAVGSIASQGVAMAMGLQDSFSWKQVAMSAVGTGIGAGMAGAGGAANALGISGQLGTYGSMAFNAAASNVISQGMNMAFGGQKKFDWRSVAASAIAAPIASKVGVGYDASFGERFASEVAGSVISHAARRAVGINSKFDYAAVAGNAIGQSLVDEMAWDPMTSEDLSTGDAMRRMAASRQAQPPARVEQPTPQEQPIGNAAGGLRLSRNQVQGFGPQFTSAYEEIPSLRDREYKVQQRQTLSEIAGTNNPETLEKIAQYNGLASAHRIRAGDVISIPPYSVLDQMELGAGRLDSYQQQAAQFAARGRESIAAAAQAASDQAALDRETYVMQHGALASGNGLTLPDTPRPELRAWDGKHYRDQWGLGPFGVPINYGWAKYEVKSAFGNLYAAWFGETQYGPAGAYRTNPLTNQIVSLREVQDTKLFTLMAGIPGASAERAAAVELRGALSAIRSEAAETTTAGVARNLRLPAIDESLAGTNTLGYTMPNGEVFLQPGLPRAMQAHVLRHEGVHSYLSVPDGAPFAAVRQELGMWGYNNSHLLKYTEEALAEGIASRSFIAGIKHPIVNPYGLSIPRITVEGSALGGAVGGTWYGAYKLSGGQ